jgi:hypothetical protein
MPPTPSTPIDYAAQAIAGDVLAKLKESDQYQPAVDQLAGQLLAGLVKLTS